MGLPPNAISEEDYIAESVRYQRNELLLNSDWTHSPPDRPLANRQEWAEYRQALRDITKQEGFPFNIVWPELPA